jgi:ADP-heptose:LPS heptosyltransferase
VRKILLVRLRLIGDVVFTTPAIKALKDRFPEAYLAYVVEEPALPVVRRNPHLDEVVVAGRSRGIERLRQDLLLALRLRRSGFEAVIDFHGGPRSAWLTLASGAPIRVGYRIGVRSRAYTHAVDRPRALRARHSVENQWDLLEPFGVAVPSRYEHPTEMPLETRAEAAVQSWLRGRGVSPAHEVIVVHVSAGNEFRRWPAESFVKLISDLAVADRRRRILITSGPSDAAAASHVASEVGQQQGERFDSAVLTWPELDLPGLRSLVNRAALFIGGDSGPLHIAATSEVPIVGIYGPTLPVRSEPWRNPALISESVEVSALECRPCDQRRCLLGDFRCLTRLSPSAVSEAAERALARRSGSMRLHAEG